MKVPLHIYGIEDGLREFDKKLIKIVQSHGSDPAYTKMIADLWFRISQKESEIYDNLSPYQIVQLARHVNRPHAMDYIENIFSGFKEIHGDRQFRDDPAIVAGFARFEGGRVAVLGHEKGRKPLEIKRRNGGQSNPEGYWKGIRLMDMANRLGIPIVTFIDTPGAYPGIEAEERNQAGAIAESIRFMFELTVPVVAVVIGEGGSGGALAIGIGNRVLMLERAIYSVISPEGGAAILFRDGRKKDAFAREIKLTAREIYGFGKGIVDEVINESGYAHRYWKDAFSNVKEAISRNLQELLGMSSEKLLNNRYEKFRSMGIFEE